MTRETAKQFLPLIQALAEGKTIQMKVAGTNHWQDLPEMSCDGPPNYYRVKPEPREWWLVAHKDQPDSPISISRGNLKTLDYITIHVREVTD